MLLCLILRLQVGRSFASTDGFRSVCGRLSFDLRLFVVGALPLLTTYCPYRARYFLNPGHWGGTQGVAVLRPALPWAEIPLPLQGATGSKPPIFVGVDVSRRHGFKTSVALHCGHISRYASECRTSSYGTITQFKCKNNYEHLLTAIKMF